MRFIFDDTSIKVIVGFFAVVLIFGFFMSLVGLDSDVDYEDAESDTWLSAEVEHTEITIFPEATWTWEGWLSDGDWFGDPPEDETYTLWSETTIDVPTLNFDIGYTSAIPEMQIGFGEMRDRISDAPFIFPALLIIIPLTMVLVYLRSVEVSM